MFDLKGPQGQNPRTTCGPRTTVWETLNYWNILYKIWDFYNHEDRYCGFVGWNSGWLQTFCSNILPSCSE